MTEWLTAAEMRAWRAYIGTYADLANALEGDLAEHLQLSPSGLTRRLDGLVKSGAVVRQGSESDRRVMMAVLTDVGFATLERAAPFHVASVRRRIFDKLDAGQVAALESIFTAINEGLHADPACAAARLTTLAPAT